MDRTTRGAASARGAAAVDPWVDFEEYVRASERRHRRLAFLLTGDLSSAEDLLQAAYAKLYPRWDKVRSYDVPDAYLRKVMVSLRTSWWRRQQEPGMGHRRAARAGRQARSRERRRQRQTLLPALRDLPDRQRVAVVLRHWCDLSEAETADIMGCSLGTVKSNTSKGLAHLRTALADAEAGRTEGEAS